MRRLLTSPRWRRRLLYLAVAATVAVAAALVVVLFPGPKNPAESRPGKPQVVHQDKQVQFSQDEILRIHAVAVKFIQTAVRRQHVDQAWPITDASLKAGMTRAQWATGDIPAPPFPADSPQFAPYKVLSTVPGVVLLSFGLLPEKGHPGYKPTSFMVELRKHEGQWFVSSFTPTASGNIEAVQARQAANTPQSAVAPEKGKLGAVWLVVPLVLVLALIVLVPVSHSLRRRRRRRRAAAVSKPLV